MKNKLVSIFLVLVITLNILSSFTFAVSQGENIEINEESANQNEENNNENIKVEESNEISENKENKSDSEVDKNTEKEIKNEKDENNNNESIDKDSKDSISAKAASYSAVPASSISLGYKHTARTTDRVNIRKESNTSSTVIITTPLNAEINILNIEKENGFYQVEYITDTKTYYGYMHADYIKLDSNIQVEIGKEVNIIPAIEPSNSDETPIFLSEDPSIANIDSNGVIRGNKEGTVIVKAMISSGLSDYAIVEVKSNKKIPATAITFGYSHTGKTTAKVYMRKKASTSSKKLVQVKKGKTVTIAAKNTTNGFYKVKYTVSKKTYSGYIQSKYLTRNSNISVVATHTKKLSPKLTPADTTDNVSYTSSNTTLATVDTNGKITAKKTGTLIITAKTDSGKSDYIVVNVKKYIPVSSISLSARSYVKVGKTATLKRTIKPTNTTEKITWKSEDTSIATVDSDGKVTGKKAGIVNIIASEPSGLIAQTVLHVAEKDCLSLNQRASALAAKYSHVDRIKYGTSVLGEPLEAFEIKGNGTNDNVIFIEAAVHGFEDEYAKDAKVLVALANGIIDYYSKNPDKLMDYTLVIVPCANPDGTLYGKNNYRADKKKPFGRCTYKGVDMNRDFRDGLFKAQESRALRDLMLSYSSRLRVQLDLHGWENSVIGDKDMVNIVRSSTGISVDKSGRYGEASGYIISYSKYTLGAHSALVEFKNSKSVNESKFESALNKIMNSTIFLNN